MNRCLRLKLVKMVTEKKTCLEEEKGTKNWRSNSELGASFSK